MNIFWIKLVMFTGSRLGMLILILLFMLLFLLIKARQAKNGNRNLKTGAGSRFGFLVSLILVLFYFLFIVFIEPEITRVNMVGADFDLDDQHYSITNEENPEGMLIVKWHIYKYEFLMNLGINGSEDAVIGDLNIRTNHAVIIKHAFPLKPLLDIVGT